MLKQWKIIKPSPQKVVAVACKRFQLQGLTEKFGVLDLWLLMGGGHS